MPYYNKKIKLRLLITSPYFERSVEILSVAWLFNLGLDLYNTDIARHYLLED